jgi:competence ComEA-like helix-hairpin-helix protein
MMATFLFVATLHATSKKPPAHPININSANSEQLQQVPGIGPATAGKILQMRKSYGPFKSVDDLLAIRGIGPKRLEKMRKYLVAGKSPGTAPKTPAANSAVPTKCPGCTKAAPSKPATLPVPLKALPKKPAEGEAQLQAKMKSQIECAGGVSCGYRATYPLQSAQTMGHPG